MSKMAVKNTDIRPKNSLFAPNKRLKHPLFDPFSSFCAQSLYLYAKQIGLLLHTTLQRFTFDSTSTSKLSPPYRTPESHRAVIQWKRWQFPGDRRCAGVRLRLCGRCAS